MSKLIWYLTLPITALAVWISDAGHPDEGSRKYWWDTAKRAHVEKWGAL